MKGNFSFTIFEDSLFHYLSYLQSLDNNEIIPTTNCSFYFKLYFKVQSHKIFTSHDKYQAFVLFQKLLTGATVVFSVNGLKQTCMYIYKYFYTKTPLFREHFVLLYRRKFSFYRRNVTNSLLFVDCLCPFKTQTSYLQQTAFFGIQDLT